jgi:putative addiction module CopG family antidote
MPAESDTIALTPEMSRLVRELVESGRFKSPAEAVHAALALLHDDVSLELDDQLREHVAAGIRELDNGLGEPWDAEAVKAWLRARVSHERSAG